MARMTMEPVVRKLTKSQVAKQKPRDVEHLKEFLKRSPVVLYSGPVPDTRKEVARERLVFSRAADAGLFFFAPGGQERYYPLPAEGKPLSIAFNEADFRIFGNAELRFAYADEPRR